MSSTTAIVTVTAAIAVTRNCAASESDSNASRMERRIALSLAASRGCGRSPALGCPVLESISHAWSRTWASVRAQVT
jgi:hypothetical protein